MIHQAIKQILPFITLILLTFSALAQNPQMEAKIDKKMQGMNDLFDLTDKQDQNIRGIFKTAGHNLQKIRSLRKTNRQEFRKQRRNIMRRMETGIASHLTSEQASQFQAMLEERRSGNRANGNTAGKASRQSTTLQPQSIDSQEVESAEEEMAEEVFEEVETVEEESTEEIENSEEATKENVYIQEVPSGAKTSTADSIGRILKNELKGMVAKDSANSKSQWLGKTLDFLYDDVLSPAVRKKKN